MANQLTQEAQHCKSPYRLVLNTCPDKTTANAISQTLVQKRLAACVSQVAGVESTYLWRGEVQQDTEVLLLIKTTTLRLDEVMAVIAELHPYELPEIIAVPIEQGAQAYLNWIHECVNSPR